MANIKSRVKRQIRSTLGTAIKSNKMQNRIHQLESALANKVRKNATPSRVGRSLGSLVGQPNLGAAAGRSLATLFGHGDYKIKTNSLIGGSNPPKFSKGSRRGTRITEREFLFDITSSSTVGAFKNESLRLNPLDPFTFPWLSNIAGLFDQWEPHGIVFEFVSTSSSYNGASQALGSVIMATEYDVSDPPYSSKQEMENSDFACSSRPSVNLMHGIECSSAERPLQILYTDNPNSTFSDLGNFQVATVGLSNGSVKVGELWISYDITFYKKQLAVPHMLNLNMTIPTIPVNMGLFYSGVIIKNDTLFSISTIGGTNDNLVNFPPNLSTGFFLATYIMNNGMDLTDNLTGTAYSNVVMVTTKYTINSSSSINLTLWKVTGNNASIRYTTKHVGPGDAKYQILQVPNDYAI